MQEMTRRAALKGTAAVAAVAVVPAAASTVTLASDDPIIAAAEEIKRVSKRWSAADEAFEKAADEAGYHSHQLEAKVDAMQNQAAQIRRETGLEPLAQEVAAHRRRYWELREEICKTPGNSIKGVLAKFRGFYHEDEVEQMVAGDHPWDDLEAGYAGSIYRDLERLASN